MTDRSTPDLLIAAARAAGVEVIEPAAPADRTVLANGLKLHLVDWGAPERPPLLLLHGFAQQAHSWDYAALGLRDLCHVVSMDLRGHGESEWPQSPAYRLSDYAGDLDAVADGAGLSRPIVCGLSLGGRAAFLHATRFPQKLRALMVVDVGPAIATAGRDRIRRFVESQQVFDSLDEMVKYTMRHTRRLRTEQQVRGSLGNAARELPDGRWTWKYDPRLRDRRPPDPSGSEQRMWQALARISCPTLLVRGAESDILTSETLEKMCSTMPGAEAVVVERAGHLVPGDNPAGFVRAVRPFLQRVIGGG